MSSEDSKARRRLRTLQRKGKLHTSEIEQLYVDNKGIEYSNKMLARFSSFVNIIEGCFMRGFPLFVPWLPYNAWAFYPFFFVRSHLNLDTQDVIKTLNHERIHVLQQRDIHLSISLPLMIFFIIAEVNNWFNPLPYVLGVPFIPTIIYGMDLLYRMFTCDWHSFNELRSCTSFEKEAIKNAENTNYLFGRKFWEVIKYFRNETNS